MGGRRMPLLGNEGCTVLVRRTSPSSACAERSRPNGALPAFLAPLSSLPPCLSLPARHSQGSYECPAMWSAGVATSLREASSIRSPS